jgi:hypothetical protein
MSIFRSSSKSSHWPRQIHRPSRMIVLSDGASDNWRDESQMMPNSASNMGEGLPSSSFLSWTLWSSCRCCIRSGVVKWTINLWFAEPVCLLRHSESGPSISFWWHLLLNLHSLGRMCSTLNQAGFQTMVTINFFAFNQDVCFLGHSSLGRSEIALSVPQDCYKTLIHSRLQVVRGPSFLYLEHPQSRRMRIDEKEGQ